ncbi:hypothetical protein BDZ89DRAFT_1034654 [Hymenopellis radicata]|nr:hypothetical protein BDZ89DRAFT_1034654 [Hymenopellis radicata]
MSWRNRGIDDSPSEDSNLPRLPFSGGDLMVDGRRVDGYWPNLAVASTLPSPPSFRSSPPPDVGWDFWWRGPWLTLGIGVSVESRVVTGVLAVVSVRIVPQATLFQYERWCPQWEYKFENAPYYRHRQQTLPDKTVIQPAQPSPSTDDGLQPTDDAKQSSLPPQSPLLLLRCRWLSRRTSTGAVAASERASLERSGWSGWDTGSQGDGNENRGGGGERRETLCQNFWHSVSLMYSAAEDFEEKVAIQLGRDACSLGHFWELERRNTIIFAHTVREVGKVEEVGGETPRKPDVPNAALPTPDQIFSLHWTSIGPIQYRLVSLGGDPGRARDSTEKSPTPKYFANICTGMRFSQQYPPATAWAAQAWECPRKVPIALHRSAHPPAACHPAVLG